MLLLSLVFLLPFFVFPASGSTDGPPPDSEDGTDGSGIDSSTNASTTQTNQTPPASSRIRTTPAVIIVSSGGITIATRMASSAPTTQQFSTKMMSISSTKTLKQSSVSSALIPSVSIKTTAEVKAEISLPSNSSMAFSTAVSKTRRILSPKALTTLAIYSTELISSLSATQAATTVTLGTSSQMTATSSETTSTSKTASDASQSSTSQPATTLLSPSLIMTTIQTATLTVRKSFLMPSSPITPSPTVSSSTDYSDGSSMLTNTAVQTTTPTSESLMSRSVATSRSATTTLMPPPKIDVSPSPTSTESRDSPSLRDGKDLPSEASGRSLADEWWIYVVAIVPLVFIVIIVATCCAAQNSSKAKMKRYQRKNPRFGVYSLKGLEEIIEPDEKMVVDPTFTESLAEKERVARMSSFLDPNKIEAIKEEKQSTPENSETNVPKRDLVSSDPLPQKEPLRKVFSAVPVVGTTETTFGPSKEESTRIVRTTSV
eukprot:m.259922 g.259922  ORF g.259922 m.259922 type:complete len:487 (+) comp40430_c2_seq1:125-1585(+)